MRIIAFKNYYLRDTTQQFFCNVHQISGCELLSKIIIFVTRHNHFGALQVKDYVANCFQKLLSSWHDTTNDGKQKPLTALWIAFKNYYLRDTTQHESFVPSPIFGCELLSKIIIFVTRHNQRWQTKATHRVVNCFQKLLSSWHDTTHIKCFQSG